MQVDANRVAADVASPGSMGSPCSEAAGTGAIHVVATTMSGSIQDQRKVGRVGPEIRSHTSRPVLVHTADSHDEARDIAGGLVRGGSRLIVAAGGAGTLNAVLEGVHVDGAPPPDLRLGVMRKGSADLVGKVLGGPDDLPSAASVLAEAIDADRTVAADVLTLSTAGADGERVERHLLGFGGVGLFGEVPRFTESRLVKVYKGVLGSLLGDLGPFFVGLGLATVSWHLQRAAGRVPGMTIELDGEEHGPCTWGAVIVLNGDLGPEFLLGRGLPMDSGTFRVVALRYAGLRDSLRQIDACRTGAVIDDPDRYNALVRDVRKLTVCPSEPCQYLVNVDGGRQLTCGDLRVGLAGRVSLISGLPRGEQHAE